MGRLVRLVTHNWPLKVGAIAFAALLYGGLVLSQNARVWPGRVPIEATGQPTGAFLLENLGDVTSIRFYAPSDVAARISSVDFRAVADLSDVTPLAGGAPVLVSVEVTSLDPRVKVLDFQPQRVAVRLDPVVSRRLPVMVDRGAVPDGLVVGEPRLGASIASVRGASSLVARVHEVAARVTIDPSGINVDGDYDLVALDERGDIVAPVDIEPERVHVRIVVGRELASRTLPVAPRLTGAPPAGFTVRSVIAVPVAVTARGPLDAMTDLEAVATEAIVLDGRTATFEQTVSLVPPSGVEVVDAPRVKVTVEIVAERGSRAFGVGLALDGARDDRTYRLSVPDVLVTLGGTRAALDAVDAATLRATLDVSGLVIGDTSVAVAVVAPPGTTLVAISPARVTVTVGAGPTSPPGPTPTPGP